MPTGLDNGDDDTTYTAGTGLTLSGTQFNLDTAYTDSRYWKLGGNAGTDPTTHFLGTTDNVTLTLVVSNTAVLRLEPTTGTPNMIGGHNNNAVTSGVMGATISGGGGPYLESKLNRVTDDYATVGGGASNRAGDNAGTTSDAPYATVSGGQSNTASGDWAFVGGGSTNTAGGFRSAVAGGYGNANGGYAVVGGGYANNIDSFASHATIGGGYNNSINAGAHYATVPGGKNNTADGQYSLAAGRPKPSTTARSSGGTARTRTSTPPLPIPSSCGPRAASGSARRRRTSPPPSAVASSSAPPPALT